MIRHVIAARFDKLMSSGRTSPLLCGCEDQSERTVGSYVVKIRGNLDRAEEALAAELLGSLIASHFGILVPESALVEITPAFAELVAMRLPQIAKHVRKSVGTNFGSELLSGAGTWPVDRSIPDSMLGSAVDIFAFDALIQNPDRRYSNPNLLTSGDNFFVYDHEAAFSFLLDISPSAYPWRLEREAYLSDHVFFRRLRLAPINLVEFREKLLSLTDEVLDQIIAEIPSRWAGIGTKKIKAHLQAIREHADEFVAAVQGRLA